MCMSPRVFLPDDLFPFVPNLIVRSRQHIVTKGDNNEVDDVSLYPPGRNRVLRSEIRGVVRGYVPFLGWAVIAPREVKRYVSSLLAGI